MGHRDAQSRKGRTNNLSPLSLRLRVRFQQVSGVQGSARSDPEARYLSPAARRPDRLPFWQGEDNTPLSLCVRQRGRRRLQKRSGIAKSVILPWRHGAL